MQCVNGIRSEEKSARVREDCMQCVNNGIRSEERSARVRERSVCNARMAYGARRKVHACERIACNAEWGPSLNQTTDVRLLAGFSFVSIDLVLYQVRSNYELTHIFHKSFLSFSTSFSSWRRRARPMPS